MSGFDAHFVSDLQKRHECPICELALRQPLQTECGHLFCKDCLEPILKSRRPLCPVDQEPISKEGTFPDNACRREILHLPVYCKYHQSGCDWLGELFKLESHLEICRYREMQCTQCGKFVACTQFEHHQRHECPMRPSICEHCGHKVPIEQMKAHLLRVCPQYLHKCPNNCDDTRTFRQAELQYHLSEECPLAIISCPYQKLNCHYECQRERMIDHLHDKIIYHTQLIVDSVVEIQKESQGHKVQEEDILNRVSAIEIKTTSIERKQTSLEQTVQIEDETRKQSLEKLNTKISLLEEQVGKTQHRLDQLLQKQSFSFTPLGGYPSLPSSTMTQRVDYLTTKVSELDHALSRCLNHNMDFDIRLQLVERATYDGILLWKIDNFEQRRREAIDGTVLSLYSTPFYTSRQGYKMCARIYLNGDGMGKGSHLSLFFVIMKGPNDALLPWPFEQKVTLLLINQFGKKNVVDQFRPDPQSSSFQRPLNREMNVASGCPLFCRLDSLKDSYIKDDCLFLGIVVDINGIPKPVNN